MAAVALVNRITTVAGNRRFVAGLFTATTGPDTFSPPIGRVYSAHQSPFSGADGTYRTTLNSSVVAATDGTEKGKVTTTGAGAGGYMGLFMGNG